MMQIFVKSVSDGGESLLLDVCEDTSIFDLKKKLEDLQGIDAEEQNLIYGLTALENDGLLSEYSIKPYSTLFQTLSVLGGGKKRKKKTYTKPKKIKHKKKKVKLAVLKFYKVDGNDKVTRLRKECKNCGNGVFMAMHFNRNYCGKCGIATFDKVETEKQ